MPDTLAAVKTPNAFEFTLGGLTQDATAIGGRVIARIDCHQNPGYRLEFDLTPGSATLSASLYFRTTKTDTSTNMQNGYRLEFSNQAISLAKVVLGAAAKLASAPWSPPASGPARFLLSADGSSVTLSDRDTGATLLTVADSSYPQGECFFPVTNPGSRVAWNAHGVPA